MLIGNKQSELFTIDGISIDESIDEFKNLPKKKRKVIRVLKGHMPFGLHEYMSSPYSYITILRDPIELVISNYYYICRNNRHRLHNVIKSNSMSLHDYVASRINPQIENGQTKLIAGYKGWEIKECNEEMLVTAIKNMEKYFSVIGLVSNFDESVMLMKKKLKKRALPFYIKSNVSKKRPLKKNIDKGNYQINRKL